MSDVGREAVLIPGGIKLLSNVAETGETLVESGETVEDLIEYMSKEQLIEIIQGHAQIGKVMVEAVKRVRRVMGDGVH